MEITSSQLAKGAWASRRPNSMSAGILVARVANSSASPTPRAVWKTARRSAANLPINAVLPTRRRPHTCPIEAPGRRHQLSSAANSLTRLTNTAHLRLDK
ncbi:hypothetical protein JQS43_20070 [Natronosporangium hydrolyticum]|uniref:Uncharacterized protein n=1 Tax=Natronosporangium hydrolyticum TaxID=2811111 RepID=A0A895Y7Y7_9ACTN|nr:hypothetical protein [Natronosporangium hydrolyticum]QSB13827.1 hypothetical protein JQS43_20070 [Natronosporangium hydrolyticum]